MSIVVEKKKAMKDLSLFLAKNVFGEKVKKGFNLKFNSMCNGETSTLTVDQHNCSGSGGGVCVVGSSQARGNHNQAPAETLEEMILRLEIEEKMGRNNSEYYGEIHRRMSCVSSSDILKSARNALNQYPRFSLDGKDAMYRCSFTSKLEAEKTCRVFPAVVGGERVVWCKPGVVAKLMGLEAMPVPLSSGYRREKLAAIIKRQNLRRRIETQESQSRRRRRRGRVVVMGGGGCGCSPQPEVAGDFGWPMGRFLYE